MNPKPRILIVDDDRRMTQTLADILTLSGYDVVESWSGADALGKVRAQSFDCALTDVRMPEMNGVELHRHLRQEQPGLPVALMTAYAADEIIQKGLDEGVVGIFNKPLEVKQLLDFFASLSRNRTIAIVDDDPAFCKTLGDILCQRGFHVRQVIDPHTEVDLFTADAQVILLDMKLNRIDGYDVLSKIRALHPDLPVLIVTGYRQEMAATIQKALELNAYACLYKPLNIPELLEKLLSARATRIRSLLQKK
jgi:CheY-like chemotaxis protein